MLRHTDESRYPGLPYHSFETGFPGFRVKHGMIILFLNTLFTTHLIDIPQCYN